MSVRRPQLCRAGSALRGSLLRGGCWPRSAPALRLMHSTVTEEKPQTHVQEKPLQSDQRSLRGVVAQYGLLALVFHESVWATCWFGLYMAVQSGVDIPSLLSSIPHSVPGASQLAQIDPTAGAVATSYLLVTCTGPVRLGFTIMCMPFVARRWDRWQASGGGGSRARERSVAGAAFVGFCYLALLGTVARRSLGGGGG